MSVEPVRKAVYLVAVVALCVVFGGNSPAAAFNDEPVEVPGLHLGLHLSQQTREPAAEPSPTPGDEILDPADEASEPLGLHPGRHIARQTRKPADEQSQPPGDEILTPANEPIELPSLRFSLLMAQQTKESAGDQSKTPGKKGTEAAKQDEGDKDDDDDEYDDDDDDEYADNDVKLISDPLIKVNTDFYILNDRLYFWVLKPVARGYGFIIPQELRVAVRNVFYNIRFPVRFLNCLFQGKGQKASYEFGRFFINTTVGFLGIANVAAKYPHLQPSAEDMGQTFAVWGIGYGPYLMLPFFGPSSVRDGLGRLGDTFLDPIWWLFDDFWTSIGIRAGEAVNDTSLRIGEYEALKGAALDPYIMIRNAWVQNRNKLIAE